MHVMHDKSGHVSHVQPVQLCSIVPLKEDLHVHSVSRQLHSHQL